MATPSPICLVKDGSGSFGATDGGVNITPSNVIVIKLASQDGVDAWEIRCESVDDLSDAAAVTASMVVDALAKTATFTAPSALGSAYRFYSRVNGGVDVNGIAQETYATTFGLYTVTVLDYRVGATDETTEGGTTGWGASVNAIIRGMGALGAEDIPGTDTQAIFRDGVALAGTSRIRIVSGEANFSGTPIHEESYARFRDPTGDGRAEARAYWRETLLTSASVVTLGSIEIPAADLGDCRVTVIVESTSCYAAGGGNRSFKATFKRTSGTLSRVNETDTSASADWEGTALASFTSDVGDNDTIRLRTGGIAATDIAVMGSVHVILAREPP